MRPSFFSQIAQPVLGSALSPPIIMTLWDDNPWWRGERLFGLPGLRRWAFDAVLSGVQRGLTPATVLRGPRQVGKTTLLNQVIDTLLAQGVAGRRIFRVQFDELPTLRSVTEPILDISFAVLDNPEPLYLLELLG